MTEMARFNRASRGGDGAGRPGDYGHKKNIPKKGETESHRYHHRGHHHGKDEQRNDEYESYHAFYSRQQAEMSREADGGKSDGDGCRVSGHGGARHDGHVGDGEKETSQRKGKVNGSRKEEAASDSSEACEDQEGDESEDCTKELNITSLSLRSRKEKNCREDPEKGHGGSGGGSSYENADQGDQDSADESSQSGDEVIKLQTGDAINAKTVENIKLAMWDMAHCDPRRCSGRKLVKLRKIKLLRNSQKFFGVVLSPRAKKVLSYCEEDVTTITKKGICVIDCSWNRLSDVPFDKLENGNERFLPYLIAANPAHYGKAMELSCAEALAASLYILGRDDEAYGIMSAFKWGEEFFKINDRLFQLYRQHGETAEMMKKAEDDYHMEVAEAKRREQKYKKQRESSSNPAYNGYCDLGVSDDGSDAATEGDDNENGGE